MVYVNTLKYACASCIKGHRSSQCNHSDRPLFEIKKKGRPLSQCDKCRAARHSRRFHSKCECKEDEKAKVELIASTSKTRRYIPIAPALPNGLKDVLRHQPSIKPMDARQRVESLLNPCQCKDIWNCRCRITNAAGLSTLNASEQPPQVPDQPSAVPRTTGKPSCCRKNVTPPNIAIYPESPLDLPPIMSTALITPTEEQTAPPKFPINIPPVSSIKSLAGSGCTCGFQCRCPGCVQHRTPQFASKYHKDCADGDCGTCVDHIGGIELPSHHSHPFSTPIHDSSILDRFLAQAAALPLPLSSRKMGVHLDPTDVSVRPTILLIDSDSGERSVLPKLKCCSWKCGCSRGYCRCDELCDGGCGETHDHERSEVTTANKNV